MTLYEEAGLSRQATAEEIRHAYHNIVRLLHPDSLRDPRLQSVAEAQLRRINAVFEVLNDPKRRAEYDLKLKIAPPGDMTLVRTLPQSRSGSFMAWIKAVAAGLALIGLVNLLWVTPKPARGLAQRDGSEGAAVIQIPSPRANSSQPSPVQASAGTNVAEELQQLRRELQEVRGEIRPARESAAGGTLPPPEPRDVDSIAGIELPTSPAPAHTNSPTAAGPPPATTSDGVVGTWLYAQRRGDVTKKDWYPPDFIELRVQPLGNRAEAGSVAGRFQARYRVGDRLISPEVRFRFEGKGDVFPWMGPNGARGEVRLRQITPLTLQVDWSTTHPGDVPSLTSGSSLLVKSPE